MTKPIVVVIENPNDDPDIYVMGDVELIQLSSYPATYFAKEDREAGLYDDYPADLRAVIAGLPDTSDARAVKRVLEHLAQDYEGLADVEATRR